MKAVVVSNGDIKDYRFYNEILREADLIVCADGGAKHMRKFGILPHVLLGDLDSIGKEDHRYFMDQGVETVTFPAEKDSTDTEIAVDYSVSKGASQITLVGCTGSRLDHTLANLSLLSGLLKKGIKGWVVNENNRVCVINDAIELSKEEGLNVSLLPVTPVVKGVTTRGLYYPLEKATLYYDSTLGVSNKFTNHTASVSLEEGILMVILSLD